MEEAVRFVNVFSAALMAGGAAVVVAVIVPALRQLSDPQAVRLHQVVTPLSHRFHPPATVISAVSALIALVIDPDFTSIQGLATLAGLVCNAGVAIASHLFEVPMNRVIAGWSPDAVPPEYPSLRARWNTGHAARTTFGLAALGLYLVAALAG